MESLYRLKKQFCLVNHTFLNTTVKVIIDFQSNYYNYGDN